jgi:probable F420-dependent oxidoreductase
MRIGITAMLSERTIDPVELALAAEARGFDSCYLPEHTHLPIEKSRPDSLVGGVEAEDYRHLYDPYTALAAMAAVTKRIRLGTGVALVAQHDPIVLAKQIATVDHLSAGRFVLGVGYGWNRAELAAHGVRYDERRQLLHEKLACMRALWADDVAEYHGEMVDLAPSYSWPKPPQGAGLTTLLGGAPGPKLIAAIAEHCDGWIPIGGAGISAALPQIRAAMEERGRDPQTLQVVAFGSIPDPGKLDHFERTGVTEVVLRIPPPLDRDAVLACLDGYARTIAQRR